MSDVPRKRAPTSFVVNGIEYVYSSTATSTKYLILYNFYSSFILID